MNEVEKKTREWMTWVEAVRLTHYARGDTFRKRNNEIGVAAVLLSTIVSAGILTSVHNNPGFWWTVAGAIIGLLATALTGVRSYLKLDDLSELHRKAGAKFGEIHRDLEVFALGNLANDSASRTQLSQIAARIGTLEEAGPGYPAKVFQKKYEQTRTRGEQAP